MAAIGFKFFWGCIGLGLSLSVLVGQAFGQSAEDTDDDVQPPMKVSRGGPFKLVRHVGKYEPLRIEWQVQAKVVGPATVFPDPLRPEHVLVSTAAGLQETTDNARTWRSVPAAAKDKLGAITAITFRADVPDAYYAGVKGKGIFATTDAGRTFKLLGGKATGLASDSVCSIYLASWDRFNRTILVCHGEDAPGLSRSVDGGKTWEVLFPDYHIYQMAMHPRSSEVVIIGAEKKQPDVRNVYFLPSLTQPWQTMLTDALSANPAIPVLPRDAVYLATGDKGLYRMSRGGGVTKSIGPKGDTEWASFGCTWGPTADAQLFYAYDPRKLGLVLMTPEQLEPAEANETTAKPAEYVVQSQGLFTGDIVMDGAHVRPNANGSQYYAVVNKALYVGRNTSSALRVSDVRVSPAVLELRPENVKAAFGEINVALASFSAERNVYTAARRLDADLRKQADALAAQRFTVQARIDHGSGRAIKSVTVDLSRFRISPRAPLFDDGQHGDGAANDGIYANSFSFDSATLVNIPNDWRLPYPGPLGLTVSAASADGRLAGAVGILTLVEKPVTSIPFWISGAALGADRLAGDVRVTAVNKRRAYTVALHSIAVSKPGDWSVLLYGRWGPGEIRDITSFYAVSFQIRADHESSDDIALQFRDSPTYALPSLSSPVPLMQEGYLPTKKVTKSWQRVIVPISRVLRDAKDFQAGVTRGMVLSSTAKEPVEYAIKDIRFVIMPEETPVEEDSEE